MQVETYEVEEITGEMGVMAADSEAIELMQKMGLSAQLALTNTETATRFPYRLMSPLELKVFKMIFPEQDKFENYAGGLIPLRILQVAAHAQALSSSPIKKLMVWHTGVAKEDPILVGHTADYAGSFYLLGRWGDALESFAALTVKAKKAWIAAATSKVKTEVAEWNQAMTSLDDAADQLFTIGKIREGARKYELEQI